MALTAAVVIGEVFAAGEAALIMQLGALLEDPSVALARESIEKLVRLTPGTARIVRHHSEEIIPADEAAVSDCLRVLSGETIPADGVILSGKSAVNEAVMTGEPLPVDKGPGDKVSSGTINECGAFDMRTERVERDRAIERLIALVQSADADKAKIVRFADRRAA